VLLPIIFVVPQTSTENLKISERARSFTLFWNVPSQLAFSPVVFHPLNTAIQSSL
jgi:hypothetical protein